MKRFWQDRTGSISFLSIGLVFVLLLFTFAVLEMGAAYENYDHCMDVLQRSCNSAVEANIDDTYRADKVLKLKAETAAADFYSFVAADLSDRYSVTVHSVDCTETPPGMTVTGTITFNTLFAQYDWDDLTVSFHIRATNYDLE